MTCQSTESDRRAVIRGLLQRQLPSNIFVQFLAGHSDIREGPFGWLLRGIAWSTLVLAPVLLLMLMQIQFLPFHSTFITWSHRLALLADLALIWWLWRKILSGREIDGALRKWIHPTWLVAGVVLSLAVVLFSWAVATFPLEWQEHHMPSVTVSLHDTVFKSAVESDNSPPPAPLIQHARAARPQCL